MTFSELGEETFVHFFGFDSLTFKGASSYAGECCLGQRQRFTSAIRGVRSPAWVTGGWVACYGTYRSLITVRPAGHVVGDEGVAASP